MWALLASAANTVFFLVIPVLVFISLGLWLDEAFQTLPVFLILGAIFGFLGGIMNLYKFTKFME